MDAKQPTHRIVRRRCFLHFGEKGAKGITKNWWSKISEHMAVGASVCQARRIRYRVEIPHIPPTADCCRDAHLSIGLC
jgi:hypothetical protein